MAVIACAGHEADANGHDAGVGLSMDTGAIDSAPADDSNDAPEADAREDANASVWHSYTMTLHDVTVKWDTTPPTLAPPSEGLTARFDWLQTSASSMGVVCGLFAEPVLVTGPSSSPTTLDTKLEKGALATEATSGSTYASDLYRAFTVTLDAEGRPASGTADGVTYARVGDAVFTGTLRANVSYVRDRDPPLWRATAETTFADRPLPWDRRHLQSSEPYEGRIAPASVILPTGVATKTTISSSDAWGTAKEHGLSLLPLDWDAAPKLVGTSSDFGDLEGNHLDGFPIKMPFGGASVPRVDGPALRLPTGSVYAWGGASETAVCPAGAGSAVCVVIGPFDTASCAKDSRSGLAARIASFGDAYVNVRALAAPGSGASGSPPDPTTLLTIHAQPPGSDVPSSADLSPLKWPASPAADGSFDTGWVAVRAAAYAPPGALKTETGISIGADSIGPPSPLPCHPPPASWKVTIDVGAISIGAPP